MTISDAEWTVPEGLTQEGGPAATNTVTSIKLSGGEQNTDYTVYCKITTSTDESDRRAIVIQVRDAATFTEPTDAETQLAAVRVALGKVAARNQQEYQIAGRMKREHSIPDLLALESCLIGRVNQERLRRSVRNGAPIVQNVHTRFVR